MRALLLAALLVTVSLVAFAPAADARPPGPGGGCHVVASYFTEASVSGGDPTSGEAPTVQPGAPRPVECYY